MHSIELKSGMYIMKKHYTEEGTLNATETAVYNSFEYLLVLQTLIFLLSSWKVFRAGMNA